MDTSERTVPPPPVGAPPAARPVPSAGHRLEDLHQATRQYAEAGAPRARSARRGGGPLLAAGAGVVVGLALTFLGDFEYVAAARLKLSGAVTAEKLEVYRRSLIADAVDCFPGARGASASGGWNVQTRGDAQLVLSASSSRRDAARQVQPCAEDFVRRVDEEAEQARNTPGEAERVMAEYAERMRSRWNSAESDLEQAIANLPGSDPRAGRGALIERWQQMRDTFTGIRGRLAAAKESVDRLSASSPPSDGAVDPREREHALAADAALQQDLKELELRLTELKLAALNVWQESSRHLEEAMAQSRNWKPDTGGDKEDETRIRATRFTAEVRRYHEDVAAFAKDWNALFTTLQNETPDPRAEAVLDLHQRARTLLGDFLFQSAERFGSMRSHVQTMSEGLDGGARHHVLQSDVVRRFTTLQDAHHRFEFAAGAIEPTDNFRLDSALRSARGLRRRSQEVITEIDTRLAAAAREKARADRLKRITEAEEALRNTRTLADQSIEDIVALQEELNLTTGMTEAFLRAMVRKDAAGSLAEMTLQDFTTTDEMVLALRAKRLAAIDETKVELVHVEASEYPVNLGRHVRNGAIGFATTFLVVLLAANRLARQ